MSGRLAAYAREVLAFSFAGAAPVAPPPLPDRQAAEKLARRCRDAFLRSGREHLALLGLGSGAVAAHLADMLPAGALVVCEQDLDLARALLSDGRLAWWQSGRGRLALDASPFAILLLLDREGLPPDRAMVLPNPELKPREKTRLRSLELLLSRSEALDLEPLAPDAAAWRPSLSCAAILRPGEPDLREFFDQFPAWLSELVVVWDADEVPASSLRAPFPVRQLARRLDGDFSAQRNAMLSACAGDFVLYLDADERLSPAGWAAMPALCAAPGVCGWHFPRLTPYPDAQRVLVGFGLWPDVQLRLFRRGPGLRFVNPVHERLAGLPGPPLRQGLALDVEILHLNRLRKGREEIEAKLAGFDQAGGGRVRHALSAEYPSVPLELVAAQAPSAPLGQRGPRVLLLPEQVASAPGEAEPQGL